MRRSRSTTSAGSSILRRPHGAGARHGDPVTVSSERLTDDSGWAEVPAGQIIILRRDRAPQVIAAGLTASRGAVGFAWAAAASAALGLRRRFRRRADERADGRGERHRERAPERHAQRAPTPRSRRRRGRRRRRAPRGTRATRRRPRASTRVDRREPAAEQRQHGADGEARGRCERSLDRPRTCALGDAELVARVRAERVVRHELVGDLPRELRARGPRPT